MWPVVDLTSLCARCRPACLHMLSSQGSPFCLATLSFQHRPNTPTTGQPGCCCLCACLHASAVSCMYRVRSTVCKVTPLYSTPRLHWPHTQSVLRVERDSREAVRAQAEETDSTCPVSASSCWERGGVEGTDSAFVLCTLHLTRRCHSASFGATVSTLAPGLPFFLLHKREHRQSAGQEECCPPFFWLSRGQRR